MDEYEKALFGATIVVVAVTPFVTFCEPAKTAREAPAGCDVACAHLEETGKKDQAPEGCDLNPKSGSVRTCADLCRRVEAHGQSFETACLAHVRTCADVAACGNQP